MKDILNCRIEAILEDIELTRLCDLPEDEAVCVEEFVDVTQRTCQRAAESLSRSVNFCQNWLTVSANPQTGRAGSAKPRELRMTIKKYASLFAFRDVVFCL